MQTYTLCDLDNHQTRCYPDCRYESSPLDHAHQYVTSAWSPLDQNSTTSGNERTTVDDELWQLYEADRITAISTPGQYPLDVTYYLRCSPDYEYASEYCYADDSMSVENVESWTCESWKSRRRTFCADNGCFTGSWSLIRDDVTLDGGYGPGYLSMYDGTDLEYMEMLSAGRRQSESETGSQYGAPTGNGNRLIRGIETFKWMTVRRGSSKYVQTGMCPVSQTLSICV